MQTKGIEKKDLDQMPENWRKAPTLLVKTTEHLQ